MKLRIDKDRCTGHGRCYGLAPGLVEDDEFGYGQIVGDGEIPAAQLGAARSAAAACPERAVIIEE